MGIRTPFPVCVVKSAFLPVPAEFDRLRVVLVATRNPLNIGAAARAMSNFGFLRLRVVIPYEVAFREARSAVGASGLLSNAEEYKSVAEAVADCTLVVGEHHRTCAGEKILRPIHETRCVVAQGRAYCRSSLFTASAWKQRTARGQ